MERAVFVYTTYPSIVEAEKAGRAVLERALAEAVRAAVKEMHSYETPAILVLPIESVDAAYLGWLLAETEDRKG